MSSEVVPSAADQADVAAFAVVLSSRGGSPLTVKAYLEDVDLLLRLLEGLPLHEVTPIRIRALIRLLSSRHHEATSIARRLAGWRALYRFLCERFPDRYPINPVQGVRAPRRARKLPQALTPDAVAGFLENLPRETPEELCDRALYELAYSSGLRLAELVGCNLADFQQDGHLLLVYGKGRKQRIVPVGGKAREALADWLAVRAQLAAAGEPALFVNGRGSRCHPRTVQRRLAKAGEALGVSTHLHPHLFRHACASHFLQSSQNLKATQELLGHASLQSTQVYTALDFQHLLRVYEAAHPRATDTSTHTADN